MRGISHQDYKHVQQVWNRITLEHENISLGEYHDVFLETDELLLADVFETFRETCLKHYKLDPAYFLHRIRPCMAGLIKDSHWVL